jgi:hypothetical protein
MDSRTAAVPIDADEIKKPVNARRSAPTGWSRIKPEARSELRTSCGTTQTELLNLRDVIARAGFHGRAAVTAKRRLYQKTQNCFKTVKVLPLI